MPLSQVAGFGRPLTVVVRGRGSDEVDRGDPSHRPRAIFCIPKPSHARESFSSMHKNLFLAVLLCADTITAVAYGQHEDTQIAWLRDIDEARMVAAESDRNVFVLFTGRGWCQPCEMLDQLLFHDAEFVSRLQQLCVPVELDFNFGDSSGEKVREARFRNWAQRYLVIGYPTMVFMDSNGQPFFVAQYPECKPSEFMDRIEKAIAQKEVRDKHFATAQSADGMERVQHIHAGLAAITEQLTTIEERHDDPLMVFYANEIVSIMTTPAIGKEISEIHEFYRKRGDARNEWLRDNRFWNTIAEFRKSSKFEEGIELLRQRLERESSIEGRLSLELTLIDFFVSLKRHEQAISQIDAMFSAGQQDERTTRRLWALKVKILAYNADRKADAYIVVDQWIAASPAGSRAFLEALELRGMMLWEDKPGSDAAIKAWDAFRGAAEPDTFEYLTANAYLARCEYAAGNAARAAELWDEILSVLERQRDGEVDIRWPWSWDGAPGVMIQAAEAHVAAKNFDAAQELLKRAEVEIAKKAESAREGSRGDVDWLRERLKAVQQSLRVTGKSDGEAGR
ncbi:MAG: Disulfide bond reductase DsbH [Planctomycetota bacterium]|jgi:thioredoxin-related protein